MCVAIRTALWEQVDGIGSLVGLTEFAYIALLVWLGTNGAGPLSLDRLVARGWHGGAQRAAAGAPPRAATRGRGAWRANTTTGSTSAPARGGGRSPLAS